MNNALNHSSPKTWKELSSLHHTIVKTKKLALQKRITTQPHITDLEYLLGAFIEMYEPHLEEFVCKLSEKGYTVYPSSGFGGKNSEHQIIIGDFPMDYVTKNKLEKIGVKFREYNGSHSLIFWPEEANLNTIKAKLAQIIDVLPDKGILAIPSSNNDAILFRRKYIPKDPHLQKKRLFERLKYSTQKKMDMDISKRKAKNPHPDKIELILGLFIEELEPQVKQVVLDLNKKGYSTDVSGFMDDSCDQMIEGDFQLDEKTVKKLETLGVVVETNPSGYTRLQFSPQEANILKIKRKWNEIASFIPSKNQTASFSMTRKARDFRTANQ